MAHEKTHSFYFLKLFLEHMGNGRQAEKLNTFLNLNLSAR